MITEVQKLQLEAQIAARKAEIVQLQAQGGQLESRKQATVAQHAAQMAALQADIDSLPKRLEAAQGALNELEQAKAKALAEG